MSRPRQPQKWMDWAGIRARMENVKITNKELAGIVGVTAEWLSELQKREYVARLTGEKIEAAVARAERARKIIIDRHIPIKDSKLKQMHMRAVEDMMRRLEAGEYRD